MPKLFQRHPDVTLAATIALALVLMAATGEIVLRFTLDYQVDFYTGDRLPGKHVFPYGVIKINSLGYPDDEPNLDDPRPRVGYVGDSVVYGVGVGSGYRFSDLLEEALPDYQHMTLASVGAGFQNLEKVVAELEFLDLSAVVYGMNLNDIVPILRTPENDRKPVRIVRDVVRKNFDFLRGRSYLYTYLRTKVKMFLIKMGYQTHGLQAFELFPERNEEIILGSIQRINAFAQAMNERGARLCVLLLPYEMQISDEAARTYSALGIEWGPTFLDRGTQERILSHLSDDIEVLDGYFAFVDPADVEGSRMENGLGEFFVYDKGDLLDWNHPNRAGHRKLAAYMVREGFCGLR